MRASLLTVVLLSLPALAGETYLGSIVSGAGADTTNATTATPFNVPKGSKLTLYCTAAGNVCVDQSAPCATSPGYGFGLPVAASSYLPTSTSKSKPLTDTSGTAAAGGAVLRIAGAAAVTCHVFLREGNE